MDTMKYIYDRCIAAGMTAEGAAGVLGNVQAESAGNSKNVEDRSPISDVAYTAAVDAGTYSRAEFISDAYGYGLFQHTARSRKAELYDMCKSAGKSISDPDVQISLMLKELERDYPGCMAILRYTTSIRDAAKAFMLNFERPYDQSDTAISYRAGLAAKYFTLYADAAPSGGVSDGVVVFKFSDIHLRELSNGLYGEDVTTLQILLAVKGGFDVDTDGIFGPQTKLALVKYQSEHGLVADGICGAKTWTEILGGKK